MVFGGNEWVQKARQNKVLTVAVLVVVVLVLMYLFDRALLISAMTRVGLGAYAPKASFGMMDQTASFGSLNDQVGLFNPGNATRQCKGHVPISGSSIRGEYDSLFAGDRNSGKSSQDQKVAAAVHAASVATGLPADHPKVVTAASNSTGVAPASVAPVASAVKNTGPVAAGATVTAPTKTSFRMSGGSIYHSKANLYTGNRSDAQLVQIAQGNK
jgi:hypothetical protein